MDHQPAVDAMRTAARVLQTGDVREKLKAVRVAQCALDGAMSVLLDELQTTRAHEDDGASSANAWVRDNLNMNSGAASVLVRNARAVRDLPLVAEAALAGLISTAHVQAFVYGLKHVGLEHMLAFQDVFLQLAKDQAPCDLFEAIKHLKDRVHPDDLDNAWLGGMDKEDFTVDAVPDGWHVTGFLGTVTGAKLKKVIDSVSAPRDAADDRTGAQRRVQGLDDLLTRILANGLPDDKGVKPHMSVFADAETVAAAAERVRQQTQHPHRTPDPMPDDLEPATLAGHGRIGPALLMYLLCISDVTTFTMRAGVDGQQDQVLNVGRTRRLATHQQRIAVLARQRGVCANPGCTHTHLEIHHVTFWSMGGHTDLDQLIGLCTRCHHLLHQGGLTITGDAVTGHDFTTRTGRPLRRRRQHGPHRQAPGPRAA